ncbi:MAG: DUF1553 domain-containing protein [Verrucomicrobiales bacterium]|nr:DUF1553 domain-containing protein [Verrucomicrobiales bacterium]
MRFTLTLPSRLGAMLAAGLGLGLAAPEGQAQPVRFNQDIRPILADACFHCHGPDPGTRKAGLRLDTEAGFFGTDGKDAAVVKGKPDDSPLFQRLVTADPDEIMPPPDSHKELKPEQIDLIRRWIAEGAPWQPHWSFINPEAPALPEVKKADWEKNPIDRFVLARLEAAGLTPAPEADRHTLARRVALDLTGLPPTPDEVEAFVNDPSPGAYEAMVDRFLKSTRWGEHRGRYWLDAARYGDTHGLHFDNYREMWLYRDWVIDSFNRNLSFDQSIVEQLAGDLLPNPTESQLIATGFQRCNITTNEGGTIDEENLANYAADRVQTFGWVMLGLTANCAQCHDHKFDPISMKDYYSLAAFFRNTTQAPKDGNVKDSGPVLVVPSMEDRPRWDALPGEIAAASKQRNDRRAAAKPDFDKWVSQATPAILEATMPREGLAFQLPLTEGKGAVVAATLPGAAKFAAASELTWAPGGKFGPAPVVKAGATLDLGPQGDFEKNQAFSYGAWVKAAKAEGSTAILARMDEKAGFRGWDLWQEGRNVAAHLIDEFPAKAIKVATARPALNPGQWQHVMVTYDGRGQAGGVKIFVNGVEQQVRAVNNSLKPDSSIRTTTPLRIGQRSHGQVFEGGSVQDVRIYSRALAAAEVKSLAEHPNLRGLLAAGAKRNPQQTDTLFTHYLTSLDKPYQDLQAAVGKLEGERDAIKARSPVTHIQEEKKGSPAMANILMRGQYDKVGDTVEAAVPASLHPLPEDAPRNRLGLARWVVDPANPLTARVTVNRFWQEVFGRGLVATVDDFGIMGSTPTHPELLDWLAVTFRESGWDTKAFFKMMVMSATYRQAATVTPEKLERDRDNHLLSRGPRFRMDAEMIRDYMLSVSGSLSPRMGGPGTKPYQPENVWEVVGMGNARYQQDTGENLYRRTVYNYWKRMAPPASLEIFNAPSREVSCVRRERTNTPLQALVTMNDPQFIEAARQLAQKAMRDSAGDAAKAVDYLARRVLARPLRPEERGIVTDSHRSLLAHYQASPDDTKALLEIGESTADPKLDAAQLAAWTMVGNQLMNLDEVLNK